MILVDDDFKTIVYVQVIKMLFRISVIFIPTYFCLGLELQSRKEKASSIIFEIL